MTRLATRRSAFTGLAAIAGVLCTPAVLRAAGPRRVIRIGTVNPLPSATGQAAAQRLGTDRAARIQAVGA
jgi:hypothetical protein